MPLPPSTALEAGTTTSELKLVLLIVAATFAGALNAVAGGGSFLAFPALLFAGVREIVANATNTVALWPAGVASIVAYRRELAQPLRVLLALGVASVAGGVVGAVLLLGTTDATFAKLLPWLLLVATVLFTFGGALTKRLGRHGAPQTGVALGVAAVAQLVISVYGGYFGGGMGIMMLAAFSLLGMTDIHVMNGLKTLLGVLINGAAVVIFVARGAVDWGFALPMVAGATVGGYVGAAVARKIDPRWVKRFVMALAWILTVVFFVKEYAM